MIQIKNLSYSYPSDNNQQVLRNLNLKINEGEFIGILGRNGSGKSTLTRLLNGLLHPQKGKIEVDGLDTSVWQNQIEIKKRVGLLLPEPDNQFIYNIVEEDVAFGPENLGLSSAQIRQRVATALETVSMQEYAKDSLLFLSGGQKQRICIAGVLAIEPKYLVLDEPTSMLDQNGCDQVIKTLLKLKSEEKKTIIMATHNLDEVIEADRVIVLDKGELKFVGSPWLIFNEIKFLKKMGIRPLDTSIIIHAINSRWQRKAIKHTHKIEELVENLCQLR